MFGEAAESEVEVATVDGSYRGQNIPLDEAAGNIQIVQHPIISTRPPRPPTPAVVTPGR